MTESNRLNQAPIDSVYLLCFATYPSVKGIFKTIFFRFVFRAAQCVMAVCQNIFGHIGPRIKIQAKIVNFLVPESDTLVGLTGQSTGTDGQRFVRVVLT